MSTENSNTDHNSRGHQCRLCEQAAVVKGVVIYNRRADYGVPLCDNCYVQPNKLEAPGMVDQETFLKNALDEFGLITTPADEVVTTNTSIHITHGPGSESRIQPPKHPSVVKRR